MKDNAYIDDINYIKSLDDYIGTYLDSRLANMMFEIAAGITAAHEYNKQYIAYINPTGEYNYTKYFSKNIFKGINIITSLPPNYTIGTVTPEFNIYKKLPYIKNVLYKGYFQSEKYFSNNRQYILNLFRMSDDVRNVIDNLYGNLSDTISIHVRRGDYVNDLPRFDCLTSDFYKKSMQYYGLNKKFIIVSDDIEWCKQNILGDNIIYADKLYPNYSKNDYVLIDLYIQTLCSDNIISNSSFSWWGAWMNENIYKKVIIPHPWFAKGYFLNNLAEDLYPYSWIKMEK